MALNDVIALILGLQPNAIASLVNYVTVVEDWPIKSVNTVYQFKSFTFGHNKPTLQRGLSAIAELRV